MRPLRRISVSIYILGSLTENFTYTWSYIDPIYQLCKVGPLEPESQSSREISIEGQNGVKEQPTALSKKEQSGQDSMKNYNVAEMLCKVVIEPSVTLVDQGLSEKDKTSGDWKPDLKGLFLKKKNFLNLNQVSKTLPIRGNSNSVCHSGLSKCLFVKKGALLLKQRAISQEQFDKQYKINLIT